MVDENISSRFGKEIKKATLVFLIATPNSWHTIGPLTIKITSLRKDIYYGTYIPGRISGLSNPTSYLTLTGCHFGQGSRTHL